MSVFNPLGAGMEGSQGRKSWCRECVLSVHSLNIEQFDSQTKWGANLFNNFFVLCCCMPSQFVCHVTCGEATLVSRQENS